MTFIVAQLCVLCMIIEEDVSQSITFFFTSQTEHEIRIVKDTLLGFRWIDMSTWNILLITLIGYRQCREVFASWNAVRLSEDFYKALKLDRVNMSVLHYENTHVFTQQILLFVCEHCVAMC